MYNESNICDDIFLSCVLVEYVCAISSCVIIFRHYYLLEHSKEENDVISKSFYLGEAFTADSIKLLMSQCRECEIKVKT